MNASGVLAILAVLAQAPAGPGAPARAEPAGPRRIEIAELQQVLSNLGEVVKGTRDAVCVFHKAEYKGEQDPLELIELKYRAEPRSIYMRWTGEERHGLEVIWRRGWNGNQLRAHYSRFTLNLQVTSDWAMYHTRHPIAFAGFEYQTTTLLRLANELAAKKRECLVEALDLGDQQAYGAASHCWEVRMDKKRCRDLYSERVLFCADQKLQLINKVQVWNFEDGAVRLVEDYGYEKIRPNVGLTDKDFDPDTYDF